MTWAHILLGRAGRGQNLFKVQGKPPRWGGGGWQDSDLFQFAKLPLTAYWVEHVCRGHLQGETSGRRDGTEKRQRGTSS